MPVPAGLLDDHAAARAQAIAELRFVHLKDADTLARMLDLCADPAPVREEASDDPFMAFFAAGEAKITRTVGDDAIARLERAGLPRDAWGALAEALARHPDHPAFLEAAARWTAETRWTDPVSALEALVPPLQAADVPLLAVVARAQGEARDVLVRRALDPWNPRTLQELLNHTDTRVPMLLALRRRIVEEGFRPDAAQTLLLVGLLAGWESPEAAALAAPLADTHPWVVAYQALDDASALPALDAWLDAPGEAPSSLGWRLVEVLAQRPRVPGWPLTRWVRHFDLPSTAFDAWGLDDDAVQLLVERLDALAGDDPDARMEAWNAAGLLVLESHHEPVLDVLSAAVARELPWDADFVARLAAGRPAIPGLADAIARELDADPSDADPAYAGADALPERELPVVVEALLRHAEAQPTVRSSAGPGLERLARDGVDDRRLLALAERLADEAQLGRATALAPLIRPLES